MTKEKRGLYTGSFDPLTLGHLNIIERASLLFDHLEVLVATNTTKKYLFTAAERVDLIKAACAHLPNVKVDLLQTGLVADYVLDHHITAVVRGVRNYTDFEYELAISRANRMQNDQFETIIMTADPLYSHLSSSIIKEIAFFDGSIDDMVPENVEVAIKKRISENKMKKVEINQ